jgi:hypothetical protein
MRTAHEAQLFEGRKTSRGAETPRPPSMCIQARDIDGPACLTRNELGQFEMQILDEKAHTTNRRTPHDLSKIHG